MNPVTTPLADRISKKNYWANRCTYCGEYHPIHNAVRLAPWVRAVIVDAPKKN